MKIALRIEALAAILLAAAPAFAQAAPNDTIRLMLAKGAMIEADGQVYEFVPRPDGSYADVAGAPQGSYRTDGGTLCLTPSAFGREVCFAIPVGKTSGEKIEAENQYGSTAVFRIR